MLVAMATVAPGSASAAADIEAVWSGSNLEIAITAAGDGSFKGTIVKSDGLPTHPVGGVPWKDLRLQPDGSYWGKSAFYDSFSSQPVAYGNMAQRVLPGPAGTTILRVCISGPETSQQPKIAPDGTTSGYNVACFDRTKGGPLPPQPSFKDTVRLPTQGKRKCLSRRNFTIRLRNPKNDPLVSATVFVNGRRVRVAEGAQLTAGVDLRGLPKGRYTVKIVAKTVLGRTIQGTRRYRTCAPRRSSRRTGI